MGGPFLTSRWHCHKGRHSLVASERLQSCLVLGLQPLLLLPTLAGALCHGSLLLRLHALFVGLAGPVGEENTLIKPTATAAWCLNCIRFSWVLQALQVGELTPFQELRLPC